MSKPAKARKGQRVEYQRDLKHLTSDVLVLGGLVTEAIRKGTEVMLSADLKLAEDVISSDAITNDHATELEEKCFSIIALQAPMAGDLRQIITTIKVAGELERSADLMVNVCKARRRLFETELTEHLHNLISAMGVEAEKLIALAMKAFDEGDSAMAAALDDIDDKLDKLNGEMIGAIFEAHAKGHLDLAGAVQLALVARYFERIGDHAVNIGERIRYMVTGWMPEPEANLQDPTTGDDSALD